MFEHSYYWIGYGVFFFITGVTMIGAMYARRNNEGTPFNYPLLALNWGTCLAMWIMVAVTEALYNPSDVTVAVLVVALAVGVVAGVAWQMRVTLAGLLPKRLWIKL